MKTYWQTASRADLMTRLSKLYVAVTTHELRFHSLDVRVTHRHWPQSERMCAEQGV